MLLQMDNIIKSYNYSSNKSSSNSSSSSSSSSSNNSIFAFIMIITYLKNGLMVILHQKL